MKKSLVALAALSALASTGAFAQSSVTISGDLSFGALNNTARTGNSGSSTTNTVTRTNAYDAVDTFNSNRINVIAVEDLGGGLKVTGRVDNRLNTSNTARNTGDMFIQVDGGFGSVKIVQYTFASHAGWNSGASRTVSATSTTAQSLSGKVAAYSTPTMSGLTASAAVDLDTSTSSVGKNGWGVKFVYAAGPVGAQLSYTLAPTAASTDVASKVTGLAVSYDFGVAKVFYNQTNVTAGKNGSGAGAATASTNVARTGNSLSAAFPMGAATLKAGYLNNKGDSTNQNTFDRATVGVDYALSKRTSLIAEFGQDKQAVTGANRASNSFVGVAHTF